MRRREFIAGLGSAAARLIRLLLGAVLAAALVGVGGGAAHTGTIKLIVPVQPGGTLTILARLLAEQIGKSQGSTIVIENRPGAGQVIGTEAVARAAPDGNTLLIHTGAFLSSPHLRKVNYDPFTSFEPICHLANQPTLLVVNSASPYRSLSDLLNAVRAKPGELTLAAAGQLTFEMFKRATNADMTFVPFPGGAPTVTALLGGHVTAAFGQLGEVAEYLNAGKLRALATLSRNPIESLPDIRTLSAFGYQDVEAEVQNGLAAPARTPKEKLSQLASWFTAALNVPEVKSKLVAQGIYPVGICGTDYVTHLRKTFEEYGRVIREANIRAE
jgi:tripartite-type tricarboxylate transporter receptor subunit TctC